MRVREIGSLIGVGFVGWVCLRGVWRIFLWALWTIEPLPKATTFPFGPWEWFGVAVLSAGLGWVLRQAYREFHSGS